MIRNIVCGTLLCCCRLVPVEGKLERALDQSSLNGSNLEDRLNRWSDILDDSLHNLADDYKAKRNP